MRTINSQPGIPNHASPAGLALSRLAPPEEKEELLDRILKHPRLPSPPNLALRVFQKTGQEDCRIDEVVELLAHDPGLCVKVLKTLNSALYGRGRPVTSVRQAVTILGTSALRSLVMALALPVIQGGVNADAGLRRFWKKSVAGAVIARELAVLRRWPAPDDEMATSLLRDLGMLLLHQAVGEPYRPMWMGESAMADDRQCAWEEQTVGVNHAEVGAALLERWQLPIEIVEPIRFHHHPELQPVLVRQLVDRAFLLDFVTHLTDLEDCSHTPGSMDGILRTARVRYGLESEDLERFLGTVRPKIEEFSAVLGVDIGACPDFDELLTRGCEEMVRASLESANAAHPDAEAEARSQTMDQATAATGHLHDLLNDPSNVCAHPRILQYEVIEAIGRGSMGIVFKAYDPRLARHVAIKLLAPELLSSEKAQQRFALEARCAASLRHEHVVAVYAVDTVKGEPFLVMEYVAGASLEDLMEQGRKFTVSEIAQIGRQTALGLAAAHQARLIHRDIKPANLLMEENRLHVRVTDFGLARAIDEDLHISQPGLLLGTPNYMSPEQVDGLPLSTASDLFSLGSVLYTLCTGELPFRAETMSGLLHAVAEKAPTPIRDLNPSIPEGLVRVIEKLHAKKPAERPASADLVAQGLQPWCTP